jgi:hypothetical protein
VCIDLKLKAQVAVMSYRGSNDTEARSPGSRATYNMCGICVRSVDAIMAKFNSEDQEDDGPLLTIGGA